MSTAIDTVLGYWLSLHRDGKAPDRMAIDPWRINTALPWTAMVNVPSLAVRISGGAIESWVERSERDRVSTLGDAFPGDDRIAAMGRRLWEGQRGMLVATGRHGHRVRLLALPLTMPMSPGHPRALVVIDEAVAVAVPTPDTPKPSAQRLQVIAGGRA